MKMRLIYLFAILAGGCGGGGGGSATDTSQMIGLWNGTSTVSLNSQTNSTSGFTHISNAATAGEIVIGDICGDGSGPHATLTSATEFAVHALDCPPGTIGTCTSVVLAITGGNGSISGGTLTMTGSGTIGGCGQSFPYTLSFTGHK